MAALKTVALRTTSSTDAFCGNFMFLAWPASASDEHLASVLENCVKCLVYAERISATWIICDSILARACATSAGDWDARDGASVFEAVRQF
jgi:hypothetical protein